MKQTFFKNGQCLSRNAGMTDRFLDFARNDKLENLWIPASAGMTEGINFYFARFFLPFPETICNLSTIYLFSCQASGNLESIKLRWLNKSAFLPVQAIGLF
jgi:hypothetical protein